MEGKRKTIHIGYPIAIIVTIIAVVLLVVLLPSGGNGNGIATPTPTATPTATAIATPTPATTPTPAVTVSINSPETVVKATGPTFYVYVDITSVNNFAGAQYDISYDPNVLRFLDVSAGVIGGKTIPIHDWAYVPVNTPGTIRIINLISGTEGTSGDGYLAKIQFRVTGNPGDSSAISFIEGLGDPEGYLRLGAEDSTEIHASWVDALVVIE